MPDVSARLSGEFAITFVTIAFPGVALTLFR